MANLKETSTWETGIYQIEENDPVHGGENGITNRPAKQLANRTKYLQDNKVQKTTTISAGNGLTGGGDLSANRSLALGTPSQITATSSNSVTAESHSHAIDKASTAGAGIVQLNDTLTSTSTTQALTANQGKILQDTKANKAGESFTGQITAPTIVVGKNQNIAYPSLGFQSSVSNGRFWSLEPASTGFNILSRSAENVQAGQVIYSLIGRDSGSYQLATTADNVSSATRLQTPRNINGVAFDGTQNITIADNTKVAKSGDSMTGSLNLLADNTMINVGNNDDIAIIKKSGLGGAIAFGANNRFRVYKSNNARVAPSDTLTQVFEVDTNGYATANKFIGALQGNADTATKLQTPRTINGVAFDGTQNIDINLFKTVNYWEDKTSNYTQTGFYRANGFVLNGQELPALDIHITHPLSNDNAYARGIGFDYGHTGWRVYTTAWDDTGNYRGKKEVLTELNGVMKSGDTMKGSLNLSSDNTMVNVGNNNDFAVIKKSGLGGAIAFGTNNRFRVYKSNNAHVAPSDTLTQVFEVDTNGYATANKFIGALQGNADTSTKLQTPRQIALTGVVTGNVNFDGSANANIATSLSANTLNDIGLGTFLKSETGYTKLPNGFILQWGVTSSVFDERSETITFPIAFPNAVLSVQLTEKEKTTSSAHATHVAASNVTRTNFEFWINSTLSIRTSAYWLAIGY